MNTAWTGRGSPPSPLAPPPESYDPAFFGTLFEVEDRHFWFQARNRVIAAVVGQLAAGWPNGYRVLEIGCGTGNTLRVLERVCSRGKVVGLDLFAQGLRYARRRVGSPLVQGDVHRLPFAPGFDLICLFDVLEHLPDDQRVLREIRTMLAPSGVLLLTVPAHRSLWSYFDEASRHCRRYELGQLQTVLVEAGYRAEFTSEYMMALYPLVWLGRRLAALQDRWEGRPADQRARAALLAQRELRVPAGLNRLLRWLLLPEAAVLRSQRQLPLGTSLLAVARNGME